MASIPDTISTLYGLTNPVVITQPASGYKAESLVIQDGEATYFVKTYHPKRSFERLLEIHRIKKYLAEQGIPTIPPLLNSKGMTLSESDGRLYAVFPYIPDKQHYALPGDEAVASAGEMLAKLHLAGWDKRALAPSKSLEPWNRDTFLKNANQMLHLSNEGTTSFDAIARKMLTIKMNLAHTSPVAFEELGLVNDTILHGDYHTHNLFFDENDKVSYVFDFERTMLGPRTTDLAYGLFMICFDFNTDIENDVSQVHFQRARSFIHAYNSVFPIDLDEFLKGIHWFFWSQLVYIEWPLNMHYFDGETRADQLLPKRLNRLEYFSSNFDTVLNTFRNLYAK